MTTPVVQVTPFVPEGPVPLMRELPPGAAYPVNALGPLREVAEAVHDTTRAPVALAAQSALGVTSLAAQAQADVETLAGAAPSSLFLLSIAESGSRKSTSDKLLMRPVVEYQKELAEAARTESAGHRNRLEIWEAQRKEILKGTKEDPDGARADLDALGAEPEPPLSPVIVATDPTVEGITRGLATYRPSLGIFSDEGGMFLGGSGMSDENRQKTMTTLSSFWDGAPINRTRGGDGAITHYGKRLAMHLMIQPVVADKLLCDPMANGQGYLARCLISAPPPNFGTRLHRDPKPQSQVAIDRFSERIGEMLRADLPLLEATKNELHPPLLALEPDAKALLGAFADDVERDQVAGGDLEAIRPFASKAAEHAARLAGVMACFAGRQAVDAETMADAITLAKHYLGEARRLMDAAAISRETTDAQQMLNWLQHSWSEPFISVPDAVQWGLFRETKYARKLLKTLEEYRWIVREECGATIKGKESTRGIQDHQGVAMSALAFDPYAVLDEIRNQKPAPAKAAIPPTADQPQTETVATLAGIAGGRAEKETLFCPVTDLFERVGIVDESGWQGVYDAAAQNLGYSDFDAAIREILDRWLSLLRSLEHPAVADALANWSWCETAARLGWGDVELFGGWSGLFVRLRSDRICRLHRGYAVTSSGMMLMRLGRRSEAPIWDPASAEISGREQNG